MINPYPALGASFILAGLSKLAGARGYRKLVADLEWTDQEMRQVGLAEVLGGLLLLPRATRRIGGVVLAATSAAVLARELQKDDPRLALPRAGLLAGALGAAIKP